jgi:hypothetical protein
VLIYAVMMRLINLSIAVLNKMRYTPIATDAHGGLCPMPTEAYALCPLLAPHVTLERLYIPPNISTIPRNISTFRKHIYHSANIFTIPQTYVPFLQTYVPFLQTYVPFLQTYLTDPELDTYPEPRVGKGANLARFRG